MFRNDFFHLDFKNNVKIKNICNYIFKILYQYSIIIVNTKSKYFTEEEILSKIIRILINHFTLLVNE